MKLNNLFIKIYEPIDSITAGSDKLLRVQVVGETFTLGSQENSVFAFSDVTDAPGNPGNDGRLVVLGSQGDTYTYSTTKDTDLVTTTTTRELKNSVFTLDNKSLSSVNAVSGNLLYYDGTKWTGALHTILGGGGGATS